MFLIKFFHFLKGYVILSISGHNKEETLNEILRLGINIHYAVTNDDNIIIQTDSCDFLRLKRLSHPAHIHILEKHGLPFLRKRLMPRPVLAAGIVAFFVIFAVGSQFIWSVEYEGVHNCDRKSLEQAVALAGVKQGTPKCRLLSAIEMKNIILNNTDDVCWAWVYIKGTKAVVRIREDILPEQIFDPDVPCDIIAMRSGIIKRVITHKGKCVVSEQTSVTPGDTIISGTYEFENEPGYQVHSKGTVEALTQHTRSGVYNQFYCYKTYTGKKRNFLTLKLFDLELPLYINKKTSFQSYDLDEKNYEFTFGKDNYLGVGVRKTSFIEYNTVKEPLSYDATVELAKRELERKIAGELLQPATLEDEVVDARLQEDGTVFIQLTMNFTEQIGTEKRIEEVTFIEPKTDNSAAGD